MKDKSAVDFFIQLVPVVGVSPVFNSPPTPSCGSTITGNIGSTATFTVQASDPDSGQIVTLNVAGLPPSATMTPSLPISGNPVSSTFSWTPTPGEAGIYVMTFTATDNTGQQTLCSITGQVFVEDCANGIDDDGDGLVDCDDPNCASFPGCAAVNNPPDCSGAYPSLLTVRPPNHQMVNIDILGVADPDGDPVTITITGITQDEPTKGTGTGSGNTCPDGGGVGTSTAQVRAERAGTPKLPGNGRVYKISFMASDGKGGECTGAVEVCVQHDQRPGNVCIDDGQVYNSTVCP